MEKKTKTKKQNRTVGTVPKYNKNDLERYNIDTANAQNTWPLTLI